MKNITTSIAALFLLTGCDNAQTSAPQRPLPEVGIVTLMSQPVSVVSELTGRTAAAMNAEVRPQVGGIIQKRLFTERDTVKAGQELAEIDVITHCEAHMAKFKAPKRVIFADQLPKNPSGKLLKRELRKTMGVD